MLRTPFVSVLVSLDAGTPPTEGLINNRNLSLTVLETGKLKIKVLTDSSEGALPAAETEVLSLRPHKDEGAPHVSYRGTNPIQAVSNLMTQSPPNGPTP